MPLKTMGIAIAIPELGDNTYFLDQEMTWSSRNNMAAKKIK